MLLSSAFPCEKSPSSPRTLSGAMIASPPASPPNISTTDSLGLASACFSLQSLISTPTASVPVSTMNELPTPPMSHRPSPMKLRLRSHASPSPTGRKRVVKRTPTRGAHKRRRDVDDDMGRDDIERDLYASDSEHGQDEEYTLADVDPVPISLPGRSPRQQTDMPPRPSTPKQSRIAPPEMPLGLERADFHGTHQEDPDDAARQGTGIDIGRDGEAWSVEQDSKLIELLISKFKLSPEDFQDCARTLGKGSGYIERRWKSLVMNGDIGLKQRSRRTRLHSTWGR